MCWLFIGDIEDKITDKKLGTKFTSNYFCAFTLSERDNSPSLQFW